MPRSQASLGTHSQQSDTPLTAAILSTAPATPLTPSQLEGESDRLRPSQVTVLIARVRTSVTRKLPPEVLPRAALHQCTPQPHMPMPLWHCIPAEAGQTP